MCIEHVLFRKNTHTSVQVNRLTCFKKIYIHNYFGVNALHCRH